MTGTKAALTAEADQERLSRKAEKQLEITARYEAELAALEAEPLDLTPKSTSYTQTLSPVIRPQSPIYITSDSKPEFLQNLSQSLPSTVRGLYRSPLWRAILCCLSRVFLLSRLYSNTCRHLFFANPAEIRNSQGKRNLKRDERLNAKRYLSQQERRSKNLSALILPLN